MKKICKSSANFSSYFIVFSAITSACKYWYVPKLLHFIPVKLKQSYQRRSRICASLNKHPLCTLNLRKMNEHSGANLRHRSISFSTPKTECLKGNFKGVSPINYIYYIQSENISRQTLEIFSLLKITNHRNTKYSAQVSLFGAGPITANLKSILHTYVMSVLRSYHWVRRIDKYFEIFSAIDELF